MGREHERTQRLHAERVAPLRLVLDGANPYALHAPGRRRIGAYSTQFDVFNSGQSYFFIYPLWLALACRPRRDAACLATRYGAPIKVMLLVWVSGRIEVIGISFRGVRTRQWRPVLTISLCLVYRESILTLFIGQFAIIELACWQLYGMLVSRMSHHTPMYHGDALVGCPGGCWRPRRRLLACLSF